MKPKYKVEDILQFYYENGTVGTLHVDFIKYDSNDGEPIYCCGSKYCCLALYESAVIGVESVNEEEYQLYLKLKEKYECI